MNVLPTPPACGSMKRDCQPDETISSTIKRDQPSQQRSEGRVNVNKFVNLFCRFHFLCKFSFRFNKN